MCRGRERAAYKKQGLALSSKARAPEEALESQSYFGRTLGLPPGLPGGGITGVLPAFGVGAWISGSTPAGGHSTPLDLASLSAKGSLACPVVVPSGAMLLRGVLAGADTQSASASAVGGGGVVSEGGACADAPDTESISPKLRRSACFIIPRKRT
jgi:hypothetical protein